MNSSKVQQLEEKVAVAARIAVLQELGTCAVIPIGFARSIDIKAHLDLALKALAVTVRGSVLAPSRTEKHTGYIEVPATWWQQLKQEHAPIWFLRRFPVKMHEISYTYEKHILMCPHSAQEWPDNHIEFLFREDPITPEECTPCRVDETIDRLLET